MSPEASIPNPQDPSTASSPPAGATASRDDIESAVRARMRAEHAVELQWTPGAIAWFCACGARSVVSGGYRTERQVRAASDRHLRAARQRIRREIVDGARG